MGESKKQSPQALNKFYKQHLGKMCYSFLLQCVGQEPDKIKSLYKEFSEGWAATVNKVNKKYNNFNLNADAWENAILKDGYKKINSSTAPPAYKAEQLRILKICEGKTETQWKGRELIYRIKNLFKKRAAA